MQGRQYLKSISTVFVICFTLIFALSFSSHAFAAVSTWQKGVAITSRNADDFGSESFQQSLRNLKNAGATYVGLVIPVYTSDLHSSNVYNGWNTPNDEALKSAINYAHSLGLHVMLKPHLEVEGLWDWRANIDPSDRDTFYTNYSNYLNHLGDIGKQTGVEGITMGTELISVAATNVHSDNTARWQKMITSLRGHFGGYLTYDANWSGGSDDFVDEIKHIGFWSSLDYVGVSAYYPLGADQANPSVEALVGSWGYWDSSQLSSIQKAAGKPLLFTEVGYKSTNAAHYFPCCTGNNGYNGQEQANLYESLFKYWNDKSYFAGVFFWNWESDPNIGGEGNEDYTPYNKPAQAVLQQWFGTNSGGPISGGTGGTGGNTGGGTGGTGGGDNGGGTGGTGGVSSSSGNWSFNATVSNFQPNSAQTISVATNVSGSASNVVIDFEIYDQSGSRVFQKFFEGQNVTNGQALNLALPWTAGAAGTYTLKAGVFKNDWTTNFVWNDSLAVINVGGTNGGGTGGTGGTGNTGGTSTPPPAGPVELNIWWPGDGAVVTGVQPFKAMLTNKNVSDYKMYWQVDGDVLNEMADNDTDYPHKETLVDVSNWTWSSNGQYKITFVAKDSAGNVIGQKDAQITVVQ